MKLISIFYYFLGYLKSIWVEVIMNYLVPSVPDNIQNIGSKKLEMMGGLGINVEKARGANDDLDPVNNGQTPSLRVSKGQRGSFQRT